MPSVRPYCKWKTCLKCVVQQAVFTQTALIQPKADYTSAALAIKESHRYLHTICKSFWRPSKLHPLKHIQLLNVICTQDWVS